MGFGAEWLSNGLKLNWIEVRVNAILLQLNCCLHARTHARINPYTQSQSIGHISFCRKFYIDIIDSSELVCMILIGHKPRNGWFHMVVFVVVHSQIYIAHTRTHVRNWRHNGLICVYFQIKLRLHAFSDLIEYTFNSLLIHNNLQTELNTITHRTIFLNRINTSNFRIVCRIDANQNIANHKCSQCENTVAITHEAMHYVREPFRFFTWISEKYTRHKCGGRAAMWQLSRTTWIEWRWHGINGTIVGTGNGRFDSDGIACKWCS